MTVAAKLLKASKMDEQQDLNKKLALIHDFVEDLRNTIIGYECDYKPGEVSQTVLDHADVCIETISVHKTGMTSTLATMKAAISKKPVTAKVEATA